MREILFRGKSPDNGEWAYGNYSKHQKSGKIFIKPYALSCIHSQEVTPETVGQFTGLTDKNGKKIFEGDIVRYNDTIHKVIFCTINGSAFFGITMPERGEIWNFDGITCANKMEVIGNIHDNPELLEGK